MPQELLTVTCMSPVAGMLITFLLTPFLTTTSQLISGRKRTTCQAPKTMFEVALSLWIRFSCSVEEIHLLPRVALPQNQRLLSPLRSLKLPPQRRKPDPKSRSLPLPTTQTYTSPILTNGEPLRTRMCFVHSPPARRSALMP